MAWVTNLNRQSARRTLQATGELRASGGVPQTLLAIARPQRRGGAHDENFLSLQAALGGVRIVDAWPVLPEAEA